MNVGMKFELLAPGVQHAEEANLCAEVSRIASDFQKSFRTGAEQEIVEQFLVLQDQWRQPAGECEDHVRVGCWKKFSLTRGDPAFPGSDLTIGAVAITTAVEGNGPMSTASAFIAMSAESGGATPRNGPLHFEMLPAHPMAVSFVEGFPRSADEIGHLQ